MRFIGWLYLVNLLVFNYASADQSEFGAANPEVPELTQVNYLRGNWDVLIQVRQDDGSFKPAANKARVKGFFHPDGRSFQTIFSTANGGFTTDIRTYNIDQKKWQALFMNAKAQRWHKFEARMRDGNMETIVAGGYSGKEDYDVRIIDKDISEKGFTKEVLHSRKDAQGWQKVYIMNFSRAN